MLTPLLCVRCGRLFGLTTDPRVAPEQFCPICVPPAPGDAIVLLRRTPDRRRSGFVARWLVDDQGQEK